MEEYLLWKFYFGDNWTYNSFSSLDDLLSHIYDSGLNGDKIMITKRLKLVAENDETSR